MRYQQGTREESDVPQVTGRKLALHGNLLPHFGLEDVQIPQLYLGPDPHLLLTPHTLSNFHLQ